MNWYAIYVKSRHESIAEADLCRRGVATFLPLINRLRQWKDRRKMVQFPLFPGYLFVNINPAAQEIVNVLRARGVVNMLSSQAGVPDRVPDEEISSLRILLEQGEGIDVYPALRQGAQVVVKSGPLRGARGMVMKKESHCMLLVNIEILGRSVGVKIYAEDLEAA